MRIWIVALAFSLGLMAPGTANADSILFTGSGPGVDGVTLNASALFDITGTALTITLTNTGDTSGSGQDVPGNALTGVLFNLPDAFTLAPVSATIAAGALVQPAQCSIGPCDATTTDVGGEFRYGTSAADGPFPDSADRGVASAGYIGGAANFGGPNLDNPATVDGPNFSIIGPGPFNPNGGLLEPLIQGQVVLALTISGGTLTTSDISNVSFQYGTSFDEPRIPEPAMLLLLGPALGALAHRLRRGKRED